MGLHSKLPPTTTPLEYRTRLRQEVIDKPSDHPVEILEDQVRFLLSIRAAVEGVIESGEAPPAIVREAQGLTRAIASLLAEIRAQDKHAKSLVESLEPEERHRLVAEYFNELSHEERRKVADIIDLGTKKGVL